MSRIPTSRSKTQRVVNDFTRFRRTYSDGQNPRFIPANPWQPLSGGSGIRTLQATSRDEDCAFIVIPSASDSLVRHAFAPGDFQNGQEEYLDVYPKRTCPQILAIQANFLRD